MAAYVDVARFKALSVIPSGYVDQIEAEQAGWTAAQLDYWSRWLDARLRKRYAAPFAAPVPTAVEGWVVRLTTWQCYLKRGVDPTDAQSGEIREDAKAVAAEVKEAADSKDGLFDLPLRQDTTATGVVAGGPLGYSEVSPYTWTHVQADEGRNE